MVTFARSECKSEHGDLLTADGVEHRSDHSLRETKLLVVVHVDDLLPICRDFFQTERLANVDEIQNI